jgi:uncharacterized protein YjiK
LTAHRLPRASRAWAGLLAGSVAFLGVAAGPGPGSGPTSLLARYDFSAPPADRWELPKALDELSGLAFDPDGRLFGHGDEQAIVYQLDPTAHRIVKRFAFGQPAARGDFEAIAIVGNRVFLSTSDGVVYEGAEGQDGEAVPFVVRSAGTGNRCEVEGLAYDPDDRSLLLACKEPRMPFLRGRLAVFRWSLGRRVLDPTPRLLLPLSLVTRPLRTAHFHPSEIVRDPATGRFLLLAGREKALVELTPDGEVAAVARLRPRLHRQPEGLALAADGSLMIGDEAAGRRATLTVYRPVR